ncbi:MAG: ATP-binding protein [Leucothrix sp.]
MNSAPKPTHLFADEAQSQLKSWQQTLLANAVTPTLAITSIVLMVSHWMASPHRLWGLVLLLTAILLTVYLTAQNRVFKTPWITFNSHSDGAMTALWCLHFTISTALCWSLGMQAASVVALWALLSSVAIIEIQAARHQLIVLGIAATLLNVTLYWLGPIPLKTHFSAVFCYIAVIFIFWKINRHLTQEMTAFFIERLHRKKIEQESLDLQRAAAIGYSTRAINHELYNLIGISLLSIDKLRPQLAADNKELTRLDTALNYMFKVSGLVLDDLGNKTALNRMLSLDQLHNDIQLLLGQAIGQRSVAIHIDFPADAEDCYFEERTGATYLIIHNLVKNAIEAVQAQFQHQAGGVVEVVARMEQGHIYIDIIDNGPGLTMAQIEMFQSMDAIDTTKPDGHGLGLSFVRRECELNHFSLNISRQKIGLKINQFI